MAETTRLVIVDDDVHLCDLLAHFLSGHDFSVHLIHDGNEAADWLRDHYSELDIVILDLMLPGKTGLEILVELRRLATIPIIILTARGDDSDRIQGLELGADDYVAKPFNPRELVARIRSVLRRTHEHVPNTTMRYGDWSLDLAEREVRVGTTSYALTASECEILRTLLSRPGDIFSREELLASLKGKEIASVGERSIDVHILHLRRKLGQNAIRTVYGRGYQLMATT